MSVFLLLPNCLLRIIFKFEHALDLASQATVSRNFSSEILENKSYQLLNSVKSKKNDLICPPERWNSSQRVPAGVHWCDNAIDRNGQETRGFVFGSCGKTRFHGGCVFCGRASWYYFSVQLRMSFCMSHYCPSRTLSLVTTPCSESDKDRRGNFIWSCVQRKQIDIFTGQNIVKLGRVACYADVDHVCEGDCLDDCIGDDYDQWSFAPQDVFEWMNEGKSI